jgi:alkanesulfonate monooxygenase SsuD/methylene tetrahydromethanopterin reductase-like flavin-dependent oxidoreductase (luciferase family)
MQGKPTDGIWEAWTMPSALSQAARSVEIGTLVMCTGFRNPGLLGQDGLGAGWHQPEFDAFGFAFDHRASRFDEALQIIAPLLRTVKVDFEGAYYQARDCELVPRGPRHEGPPILIAGFGPRMLQITARFADQWNTAWHDRPAAVAIELAKMRAACQEVGRDPSTLGMTASVPIAYPELDATISRSDRFVGSKDEVVEFLRDLADLGVEHVVVELAP